MKTLRGGRVVEEGGAEVVRGPGDGWGSGDQSKTTTVRLMLLLSAFPDIHALVLFPFYVI